MSNENAFLVDLSATPQGNLEEVFQTANVPRWPTRLVQITHAPWNPNTLAIEDVGPDDIGSIVSHSSELPTLLLLPNGSLHEGDFLSKQVPLWIAAKGELTVNMIVAEEKLDDASGERKARLLFLPKRGILIPPHAQLKRFSVRTGRNLRDAQAMTRKLQEERGWPLAILYGEKERVILYFAMRSEPWTPSWSPTTVSMPPDRILDLALNSHLRRERDNYEQATSLEREAWRVMAYATLKVALLTGDKQSYLPVAPTVIAALGEELTMKLVDDKLASVARAGWKFGLTSLKDVTLGEGDAKPIVVSPKGEKFEFDPFSANPEWEFPFVAIATAHGKVEKLKALDCMPYRFFWNTWIAEESFAPAKSWVVELDNGHHVRRLWLSNEEPPVNDTYQHKEMTAFAFLEEEPSAGGIRGRRIVLSSIEIAEYAEGQELSRIRWERPKFLADLFA